MTDTPQPAPELLRETELEIWNRMMLPMTSPTLDEICLIFSSLRTERASALDWHKVADDRAKEILKLRAELEQTKKEITNRVPLCDKHAWLRGNIDPNSCAQCSITKVMKRAKKAEEENNG